MSLVVEGVVRSIGVAEAIEEVEAVEVARITIRILIINRHLMKKASVP